MILQGRNLTQGLTGADVGLLQSELTKLGYTVPPAEAQATQFGAGTLAAVEAVQAAKDLPTNGILDAATAAALTQLTLESTFSVSGHVTSATSLALGGLSVQVVDKNVGGDSVAGTTTTNADGSYSVSFVIGPPVLAIRLKTNPDLQAQVVTIGANGQSTVDASSAVALGAVSPLTLDIALPASMAALTSEYETLTASLATFTRARLKDLKESDTLQDVTYLSVKSGWDARAVAMASLADQFSTIAAPAAIPAPAGTQTAVAVSTSAAAAPPSTLAAPFYYALFRAGLPADADSLFAVGAPTVQAIWTQAIAQNVIPSSLSASLPQAVATFQTLAGANRLTAAPNFGVSNLHDLVSPALGGAGQAQQFAALLTQHAGDWTGFWADVGTNFGAAAQQKLQLVGQLSYLTLNNAPLIGALTAAGPSTVATPADLATHGYWDPTKWTPLIGTSIPAGVAGATPAAQAANYAAALAAHVRLSFPTACLAGKISAGAIPLSDSPRVGAEAAAFMSAHQSDFVIGVEPIDAYLARTKPQTPPSAAAIHQMKRLHRVMQITPNDTAMAVMLSANLDSAYAVMRHSQANFVRSFSGALGGTDAATGIYLRARQIHGAALNVALSYAHERVSPSLGAGARHGVTVLGGIGAVAAGASPAAATLETLFGSLDTCDCEDCESILSPAAYLVDVLNYLDQPQPTGSATTNSLTVLLGRRPDLQYLPLTCENTDTALPYIDVANETLEAFVADGQAGFASFQGFDTGTATSAELIAAPQNVNNAAYATLQASFFPAPLPFNRPLALLRQHMGALGLSLPDAMETLRKDDSATGGGIAGAAYGWNDILIERLQLSRDEMRVFTDPTLGLADIAGLPLATLQTTSLHDLVRRFQITYDDVVAVLQTGFVNPNASLIERVQRLGAPFTTIAALKASPVAIEADFIAALPANLDYSQYAGTGPLDVVTWLTSTAVYNQLMGLITIANPTNGAIDCSGDQLQLRYANPDPTKSLLSEIDWIKIVRFIRLWQKLQAALGGGDDATTIQQTDALLSGLFPAPNPPATRAALDRGFGAALLRAGFVFEAMELLSLTPDPALPSVLACAGSISTVGSPSFYESLFLAPALAQDDLGVQIATLSGILFPGDTLQTFINGVEIDYVVVAGDTGASAAANIAKAINSSTLKDPQSGQPIGQRFYASVQGSTIALVAGFQVTISPAPGQSETLSLAIASPIAQTLTVTGVPTPGDVVAFAIDGLPMSLGVNTGDGLADIASNICNAINATTKPDPYCLQPLNAIIAASSTGPAVTLVAASAGAPFTLACSVKSASGGSYAPWSDTTAKSQGVEVSGTTLPQGAILSTSINGAMLNYVVGAAEPVTATAANIAAAINASSVADPVTGLAVNALVLAAPDATVKSKLILNPVNASVGVTIAASMSTSSYAAGRAPSPFADNGYGAYLSDPTQTLLTHAPMLCAACNLTGAEFAQISQALGFKLATQLTLDNVSALYRHGWLAHALGISVVEFLRLKACSAIDPFGGLDLGAPGAPPVPGLIRSIKLVQAMGAADLDPAQALYLVYNEDIGGTLAPSDDDIGGLAMQLRADFAAINATFARKADPDGSIAQSLMALVYGAADTSFFFSLVDGTYLTTMPFAHAAGALPQAAVTASVNALSYDPVNKVLSFSGVLNSATQAAIKTSLMVNTTDAADNLAAGANETLTPASMTNIVANSVLLIDSGAVAETVVVSAAASTSFTATLANAHNGSAKAFAIVTDPSLPAAVDALALANQQAITPFFAQYPELLAIYNSFAGSSLSTSDRHTALLNQFLPILIGKRKQEQALSDVSAAIGQDTSFAVALLQDPRVLASGASSTAAALSDFTAIETGGLSVAYHLDGKLAGGAPATSATVGPLQFAQGGLLSGTIAAGVTLTTHVNGVALAYVTQASDTDLAAVAGHIAQQINTSAAIDPMTGLPIANLVTATALVSASGVSTVIVVSKSPADPNKATTFACAASNVQLTYLAGAALPSDIVAQLPAGISAPLPQGAGGGAIAVAVSGFIVPPQDGAYNFSLVLDPGASATMTFSDTGQVLSFGAGAQTPLSVTLSASALAPVSILVAGLRSTLTLCWQSGGGFGWQPVPAQNLYPQTLMDRLRDTYVRFLKATSLASALALDANEIAYLAFDTSRAVATTSQNKTAVGSATFHPASMANIGVGTTLTIDTGAAQETVTITAVTATSFTALTTLAHDGTATAFPVVTALAPKIGMGWLNWLPSPPNPPGLPFQDPFGAPYPDAAMTAALDAILAAILDFARLKQALSPSDERLMQMMQAPSANLPNGQQAIYGLTGWQPVSLNALLLRFFGSMSAASLGGVENCTRVYDAMQIVTTSGVSAGALLGALTNAPSSTGVSALQSALRAKYAEADWLTVVQPIYDALRSQQRDALVAYILQSFKANPPPAPFNGAGLPDTADKLFEFFLMDVENQPAVLTSRIRLAISSVQLFIERILRGLEPQVVTSDVDPDKWAWMKRYRVWQANREVFLWPENWLYPELRDDQSPIYQTTASALLQGDITDGAATSAYLDYLSNLEEVAKLEPCGLYYVPAAGSGAAATPEMSYVIARTAGAHRKYFFREAQDGVWSPWTEVKIECEDMPLTPIVWGGRLFLFWLKVTKSAPASATVGSTSNKGAISSWTSQNLNEYVTSAASSAGQSTYSAVLFWSEYHDGKWRPQKSSNVRQPAYISLPGDYNAASFELDRDRFRLLVHTNVPRVPSDSLVLGFWPASNSSTPTVRSDSYGFVLHNTHSLPSLIEDLAEDQRSLYLEGPMRLLLPQRTYSGTQETSKFTIQNYADANSAFKNQPASSFTPLSFNWQPKFTEPQNGPGDVTGWPFFYEDRRNQFYVTVNKDWRTFAIFDGFGAGHGTLTFGNIDIPPLVVGRYIPPFILSGAETVVAAGGEPTGWSVQSSPLALTATIQGAGFFQYQGRIVGALGSTAAVSAAIAARS